MLSQKTYISFYADHVYGQPHALTTEKEALPIVRIVRWGELKSNSSISMILPKLIPCQIKHV